MENGYLEEIEHSAIFQSRRKTRESSTKYVSHETLYLTRVLLNVELLFPYASGMHGHCCQVTT